MSKLDYLGLASLESYKSLDLYYKRIHGTDMEDEKMLSQSTQTVKSKIPIKIQSKNDQNANRLHRLRNFLGYINKERPRESPSDTSETISEEDSTELFNDLKELDILRRLTAASYLKKINKIESLERRVEELSTQMERSMKDKAILKTKLQEIRESNENSKRLVRKAAAENANLTLVVSHFLCPLCLIPYNLGYNNPVILNCDHIFCNSCKNAHSSNKGVYCPRCKKRNLPMTEKIYSPIRDLLTITSRH